MVVQKQFSQAKVLDAPHQQVWDIISKATGLTDWLPVITSCRLEGEGENAKRYCETSDGKQLKETIDRIDHENFVFEYTIVEQNMMPISNYRGKYEVLKLENGKTQITWSSTFEVEEANLPAVEQGLTGLYQMGFEGLESLAKRQVA